MNEIDETINRLERLYQSITGAAPPPPESPLAPIPPEMDAELYVGGQVDRLLGILGNVGPGGREVAWAPAASVAESADEYVIFVELAGVPRSAVEVSVARNLLLVTGTRPLAVTPDARLLMNERPLGRFRRTLALPPGVSPEHMSAHMRDGLLEIRIPKDKAPEEESRPITVE